jgi:hypothetical protein
MTEVSNDRAIAIGRIRVVVTTILGAIGLYAATIVGFSSGYSPRAKTLVTFVPLANPWAVGNEAYELVQTGDPDDIRKGRALARSALRQDATVVPAITALALSSDIRGAGASADGLFKASHALSRRDLTTHLWFIEKYVAANDVRAAMRHYDAALRTSAAAHQILLPVVIEAAFEPSLAPPIVERLLKRPAWAPRFLSRLVSTKGNTNNLVALFEALQDGGYVLDPADRNTLIDRSVNEALFEQAFRLSGRPGRNNGVFNDRFNIDPRFHPFDWKLVSTAEYGAEISKFRGASGKQPPRRVLRVYSNTGSGGEVASQLLLLTPGLYSLKVSAVVPTPKGQGPYLITSCGSGGGIELARLELTKSGDALGDSEAIFSVPASDSCRAQWLRLSVRPSKTTDALPVLIMSVEIDRQANSALPPLTAR